MPRDDPDDGGGGGRKQEIHLDITLAELGDRVAAAAVQESHDECHRDWDGRPLSDLEMLERIRRLEQEIGQQLIFKRGERPQRSA